MCPPLPFAEGFRDTGELVFVDALGIVKQTSDESAFAIVDTSSRGKTQKAPFLEIALALLDFHGAFLGRGRSRGFRVRNAGPCFISSMILSIVSASERIAPVQGLQPS